MEIAVGKIIVSTTETEKFTVHDFNKMLNRITTLDEIFDFQLKAMKIKPLEKEYKFHAGRRWRFDRANIEKKIAFEFEGGIYSGGRHTRGKGFEGDCEKYNAATAMGWRVFRYTRKMLESGQAIKDYLGMK
jgi:hypothetical protein